LNHGKKERHIQKEQIGEGWQEEQFCANMGDHANKKECQVQPEAQTMETPEATIEVTTHVIQDTASQQKIRSSAA
jgi:hypothetical protein